MNSGFVPFDQILERVRQIFENFEGLPDGLERIILVRDLIGVLHISVSDTVEESEQIRQDLRRLASDLSGGLGARASSAESAVLFVDDEFLDDIVDTAFNICRGVYLVDRLVTGQEWGTVRDSEAIGSAMLYTLFSVKGGVGRSTTAALLAWHLAKGGERVIVVDLDLESPGLSPAVLEPPAQPSYGVTDWFVEDLVGQSGQVIDWMAGSPRWAENLEGDVQVVPAHGRDPGEYLPKLGRVFMDIGEPWSRRLHRMLLQLEEKYTPTIILLESRSGLHDIAASLVTNLGAQVLLFITDSESNWTDYEILFGHWKRLGLAPQIRENLSAVSAMTPFVETTQYLHNLKVRSWDLFRENFYDALGPEDRSDDRFSFDLDDYDAPHSPLVIKWASELAAGSSLLGSDIVNAASAYGDFFERFDRLHAANRTYLR